MARQEEIKVIISGKDESKKSFDSAGSNLDKLKGIAKTGFLAIAAAAGTAAVAIGAFAVTSIKSFIEAEKEMVIANKAIENALTGLSKSQLENITGFVDLKGALNEVRFEMEKVGKSAVQLGYDDEEASKGFAKLFQASLDVKQAQEDLKLAMDLAAFSGRDLASAVDAVMKVHAGGTRILKEFGIEVEEGITVIDALDLANKRVKGSAQAVADTTAGQLAIMKISWQNLKESLGESFVKAIEPAIKKLNELMQSASFKKTIDDLKLSIESFINFMFKTVPETIGNSIDWFNKLWESLKNLFDLSTVGKLIIDQLRIAWETVWLVIQTQLKPAFDELLETIKPYLPLLEEFGKTAFKVFGIMILGAVLILVKALTGFLVLLTNSLTKMVEIATFIIDVGLKAWELLIDALAKVIEKFESIYNWAKKAKEAISGGFGNIIGKAGSTIGNILGINLQSGGIVPGPVGAPVPAIVHGGETVIPAGRSGGITLNILGGNYLSEDAAEMLGNKLIDILKLNLRF